MIDVLETSYHGLVPKSAWSQTNCRGINSRIKQRTINVGLCFLNLRAPRGISHRVKSEFFY